MRHVRIAVLLAAAVGAAAASAQSVVYRCEDTRGRVTYSDTPCPATAKAARKLEPTTVLKVGADGEATRADAAGVETRLAGRLEPSRPSDDFDPVQEDQKLSAQIAAQRRACEAMAHRLRYLEHDVAAAAAGARSSLELALRRAQEDYRVQCPRR
jgi:hypothetical protein